MVRAMTAASHLIGWKLLNPMISLYESYFLKTIVYFYISFCCLKNLSGMPVPSHNPLATITNYNWQVAPLTRCHKPPRYLVLGAPLLSPW